MYSILKNDELFIEHRRLEKEHLQDVVSCVLYLLNDVYKYGVASHNNCWKAALFMVQFMQNDNQLSKENACIQAVQLINTIYDVEVFPLHYLENVKVT